MKLIISPAKKMNMEEDLLEVRSLPAFLDRTQVLLDYMQGLDRNQAKTLWKCNDAIADLNYARIQSMDLHSRLTPAFWPMKEFSTSTWRRMSWERKNWSI